jgi:hypothetical protein
VRGDLCSWCGSTTEVHRVVLMGLPSLLCHHCQNVSGPGAWLADRLFFDGFVSYYCGRSILAAWWGWLAEPFRALARAEDPEARDLLLLAVWFRMMMIGLVSCLLPALWWIA